MYSSYVHGCTLIYFRLYPSKGYESIIREQMFFIVSVLKRRISFKLDILPFLLNVTNCHYFDSTLTFPASAMPLANFVVFVFVSHTYSIYGITVVCMYF